GKGRCNLTNTADVSDAIVHFGPNGRFLRQAFSRFYNSELIAFFKDLGVPTVIERGGRVFPVSGQAGDITKALELWTNKCGATLKTRSQVDQLLVEKGRVFGVKTSQPSDSTKTSHSQEHRANHVIVTTGGASYPATGSTGDGYRLAESVGHSIRPIMPALVPLETSGNIAERIQDLNLRNVSVKLL
ncbi:MAG: FAD-binding protein, partial [Deltaproteobacteria bacterium]|nr:FAD-binding protein [Deltaproteobacteria bacterium]